MNKTIKKVISILKVEIFIWNIYQYSVILTPAMGNIVLVLLKLFRKKKVF